jgi:CheY-like chemotaxis protein
MNEFKCILLIDDDEVSNYLTEITIKSEGYAGRIETALNGEEGLSKLENLQSDNIIPELIILDISMPVMDGFTFLQKFNELNMENKPKVVILTSSRNPKDLVRINELKVIGYLNKPFSADEFKNLISDDFLKGRK